MGTESISEIFKEYAVTGEKALAVYITAGYPDRDRFIKTVELCVEAGADIIEVGVPFSDPIADGPVIQESTQAALKMGVTLYETIRMVGKLKERLGTPVLLMGYWNPFMNYGQKKLFSDCYHAGVDGFIIPDLPPEEGREFYSKAIDLSFATVQFVTPVTEASRIPLINQFTSGFVYFISITGITGARISSANNVARLAGKVSRKVSHPLMVGFGISTPDEARVIAAKSSGVIVGTAFLKVLKRDGPDEAGNLVYHIKNALRAYSSRG